MLIRGSSTFTAQINLDSIFHAPTTTDRDRKEIVCTLVRAVIVEERTDEEIRLRIVWQDGTPGEMVEAKLVPSMHRKIMEMAADGKQAGDIAQWLNDHGHVNLQGHPWTEPTVRTLIQRKRKECGAKKTPAPRESNGCRFRRKPNTDSEGSRTPIPNEAEHRSRSMPNS